MKFAKCVSYILVLCVNIQHFVPVAVKVLRIISKINLARGRVTAVDLSSARAIT